MSAKPLPATAPITNLQAYLCPSSTGLPASAGSIPAALQALLGNPQTGAQQFFAQKNFAANLVSSLNSGAIDWIEDTDDNGNTMYFCEAQDNEGNSLYLEAMSQPGPSTTDLPQYTAPDGQTYDVVGSISLPLSWNDNTLWVVNVPVGFTSGTGALILQYYAWDSFMKPILNGVLQGIKSLCSSAPETDSDSDLSEAEEDAEEDAELTDDEIAEGAATLSMTAGALCFAGAALLIAIPFILSAIEHPTGHNVSIYNLTPYTLTWQQPYIDDCQMTLFPQVGDDSQTADYVISAPSTSTPPGGQPVTVYHEGDFAFQSTSDIKGISWAMQFTFTDSNGNPVGSTAAVMYDLPLNVANSLAGAWGSTMTSAALQSWAQQNYGQVSNTQLVFTDPVSGIQMTLTYNALSGKQPLPGNPDAEGYVYQSAIVFQYPTS